MDRTISSFLQHLIVEKGFSRNTSDAYRNDLGQFWEFLQDNSNSHSSGNGNESYTWSAVDI
ncbi:MAG: site-specific integrase, partial [Chloroflexi bacterium]|nr:site-specific integrase [Chloroflexota bacterium]